MRIERCVCKKRLFSQLKLKAAAERLSLEQLCEATGAGRECGKCLPYLCRMMRTGQVVFCEIVAEADELYDPTLRCEQIHAAKVI
ncbi:hypothetical protein [Poriferisphaera sp. WC338]|uniref:hypothetical protein n=1 Tax=Poriferisphaera sp. WC338 TaxID=3425129 RepID=UPI003D816122